MATLHHQAGMFLNPLQVGMFLILRRRAITFPTSHYQVVMSPSPLQVAVFPIPLRRVLVFHIPLPLEMAFHVPVHLAARSLLLFIPMPTITWYLDP